MPSFGMTFNPWAGQDFALKSLQHNIWYDSPIIYLPQVSLSSSLQDRYPGD